MLRVQQISRMNACRLMASDENKTIRQSCFSSIKYAAEYSVRNIKKARVVRYRGTRMVLWLLSMAIILGLSFWPEGNQNAALIASALTNLGHIPAYCILSLTSIVMVASVTQPTPLTLTATTVVVAMLGGLVEVLQPYVGRTFSYVDVSANITGSFLAGAGYYHLYVRRRGVEDVV